MLQCLALFTEPSCWTFGKWPRKLSDFFFKPNVCPAASSASQLLTYDLICEMSEQFLFMHLTIFFLWGSRIWPSVCFVALMFEILGELAFQKKLCFLTKVNLTLKCITGDAFWWVFLGNVTITRQGNGYSRTEFEVPTASVQQWVWVTHGFLFKHQRTS